MSWLELSLDDDPETLRVALELIDATVDTQIDAHEDDLSFCEEGCDAEDVTTSDSAEEKPKTASSRPMRTERKRKNDIVQLKQKVARLETTLSDLQRPRQNQVPTLSSIDAKDVTGELVWRDVALRQRRHRVNAEMENQNLRTMLHSQTLVGQQLLHLMQYTASHDAQVKKELKREAEPTAEQARHLEELVAQADRVFASECFHTPRPSFQDVRVHEDGAKGMVVDTFAGWIVPLTPDKVVSALWSGMLIVEPSNMCKSIRMDMEQKDDTLIASYTLSATVPDRTYASSTGTAVSRRYETADGATLIVSVMSGEMLGITPGSQDTITAIELHWMRIRPYKTLVESETGVLTQVQLNRQIRLTFSADHSPARRNIVNAVIELVLLQVEEELTQKQEMVEKLMFVPGRTA